MPAQLVTSVIIVLRECLYLAYDCSRTATTYSSQQVPQSSIYGTTGQGPSHTNVGDLIYPIMFSVLQPQV